MTSKIIILVFSYHVLRQSVFNTEFIHFFFCLIILFSQYTRRSRKFVLF